MIGGVPSGFRVIWSLAAEQEASRHMRPRATTPSVVRQRYGMALGPSGDVAGGFGATSEPDRQILADAAAAGARFLITEDVDDYGARDLQSVGISAVNPDLFMAERLNRDGYAQSIDQFVARQIAPPTTGPQFHAAVARSHPLLFAAHADLFDVEPEVSGHARAAVLFRGPRCLRCEQLPLDSNLIVDGLCPECRASTRK